MNLGQYTAGEKPAPVTIQFTDSDGVALSTSTGTWVARLVYKIDGAADADATTDATATVNTTGLGTFTPPVVSATPGSYVAQLWIGNGTNRYASELITWVAIDAVGTPPSI
jgi:hypothetical protein